MRSKSFTRDERKRHISHKKYIAEQVYGWSYYQDDGRYDKGKIHCSCGMCSRYNKTNNKGRRRTIKGNYAPSTNWSHTDRMKIDSMEEEQNEFLEKNIPYSSMESY